MKWFCRWCNESVYAIGIYDAQKEIENHLKSEKHLSNIKQIVKFSD